MAGAPPLHAVQVQVDLGSHNEIGGLASEQVRVANTSQSAGEWNHADERR